MILTAAQIEQLLKTLDRQFGAFTAAHLGPNYLTDAEKKDLSIAGIDYNRLYDESRDPITMNFHLGMLSNILGDKKTKSMTFDQLKSYIQSGQNIPLNNLEKRVVESIKSQSLADIKAIKGRIFNDVNQVISRNNLNKRSAYEKVIRDQVQEGIENRKSVKDIARSLSDLTGDWSRDFTKMTQYISHSALNEGRAAMTEKRYGKGKAQVYFDVQAGACKHCVRLYLTGGEGSAPIIFNLDDLRENGTNIGRKPEAWMPTVYPIHPHCRCLMCEYSKGMEWDGGDYVVPKDKEYIPSTDRQRVRIVFQGKEYFV